MIRAGHALLIPLALLTACGEAEEPAAAPEVEPESTIALEQAAIEAGIVPDLNQVTLAGAFERDSDLGTDKFCAVGEGDERYRIGIMAVFGPGVRCEALGTAERQGETVTIRLSGEDECQMTAQFDGVQLRISGSVPEGCDSYCGPRATFAGTNYFLVGEGDEVARSTRGEDYEHLCGAG